VVSIDTALEAAQKDNLDLVEISPDSKPPVCKVMDYGKEIKFRPGTDVGDYQIKLRSLVKFLENGDKAKITLRFRGREMAHQELGMEMMKRVEADLSELAQVEQFPKLEGRQMTMVMAPFSKKKK
jgi:translation initiation factor IF-3